MPECRRRQLSADSRPSQGRRRTAGVDRCTETEVVQKRKTVVCLLLAASYPAAAAVFRTGGRSGAMRPNSIPKGMLATYERIVPLPDDVCDRQLNSEYRDLARAMTGALCRKRPSPLTSGQPRTWAGGIVYVLGRNQFSRRPFVSSVHDNSRSVRRIRGGESTVHAKARVIEKALGIGVFDP